MSSHNEKPKTSWIHVKFFQTHKEKLIPIVFKVFQKNEEKSILHNSFSEAGIILISKPDKDTTTNNNNKNLQTNMPNEYMEKSSTKY